jgi:ArsR family transcriptional regulator, arsenate/arsenite/antimonite-responsive transcriptional repressor
MKLLEAVDSLAALAQASRMEIFRLLVKRGPEGFTPGDLGEKLDIPAPTLSFHLKELQRAKLVTATRDGRFLHYSADFATMNGLIAFLTENCCSLGNRPCPPSNAI